MLPSFSFYGAACSALVLIWCFKNQSCDNNINLFIILCNYSHCFSSPPTIISYLKNKANMQIKLLFVPHYILFILINRKAPSPFSSKRKSMLSKRNKGQQQQDNTSHLWIISTRIKNNVTSTC